MNQTRIDAIIAFTLEELDRLYGLDTLSRLAKSVRYFERDLRDSRHEIYNPFEIPNVDFIVALHHNIRSIVPWYRGRDFMRIVQHKVLEHLQTLDT